MNTRLPEDIVVVSAKEVSEGFNAIGSCVKKEYTYRVYNSRMPQRLLCGQSLASIQSIWMSAVMADAAYPFCRHP